MVVFRLLFSTNQKVFRFTRNKSILYLTGVVFYLSDYWKSENELLNVSN